MESELRLEPGVVFARDFRVVSLLAEGGMGAVYIVEQQSTGKQRALKVMHPNLAKNTRVRERFAQEAQLAARIESDHVVEVLGAGVDEPSGIPWLAMELLKGQTLTELVEGRGAQPRGDVVEIMRQLCHALTAAHGVGLVHRDLKPDNIFLAISRRSDARFTVKLLDFGIAKWIQDSRTHVANSQLIGTPLWMAPEQFEAGKQIRAQTDIWALGLIAFYLLTGKRFWRAANSATLSLSDIVSEMLLLTIPSASQRAGDLGVAATALPQDFDAWFARCVARDTAARFATAAEASAGLAAVLGAGGSAGAAGGLARPATGPYAAAASTPGRGFTAAPAMEPVAHAMPPEMGPRASVAPPPPAPMSASASPSMLPPQPPSRSTASPDALSAHAARAQMLADTAPQPPRAPQRGQPTPPAQPEYPGSVTQRTPPGARDMAAPDASPRQPTPFAPPPDAPQLVRRGSNAPAPDPARPHSPPYGSNAVTMPVQWPPGGFVAPPPAAPTDPLGQLEAAYAHEADPRRAAELALQIARAIEGREKDPARVTPAYERVLSRAPDSFDALAALAALYRKSERWPELAEVLQRSLAHHAARVGTNAARAWWSELGEVAQRRLDRGDVAREAYRRVLAIDPGDRAALSALLELYARGGEWDRAVDLSCRYLKDNSARIDRELKFRLWHNLGVIYRDRLANPDDAAAAFAKAAETKPEDPAAPRSAARLWVARNDVVRAAEHWQRVIALEPRDAEAYGALFDGYTRQGAHDRAWCVAHAASFVLRDEARPDLRAYADRYRPQTPPLPAARLDDMRVFRDLMHPGQDPYISRLTSLALRTLRRLRVRPPEMYGLSDAEAQDPERSQVPIVRLLAAACDALGVMPRPRIYLRPQQPAGLGYVPSEPWATVAGGALLSGYAPEELLFVAGRHAAGYRSELYARALFTSAVELRAVLRTLLAAVAPELEAPPEIRASAQSIGQELARDGVEQGGMRKLAVMFRDQGGSAAEIDRWPDAAEKTACQAGLLFAGDLRAANRMVHLDPGLPSDMSPQDKIRELVSFAVSERYLRLREALGLALRRY